VIEGLDRTLGRKHAPACVRGEGGRGGRGGLKEKDKSPDPATIPHLASLLKIAAIRNSVGARFK
jgi:hypothetical protein